MAEQGWCTIESDPGVFTELISKFGVKNVQVEELWDLEDGTFKTLHPMYGLIFLFKYDKNVALAAKENVLEETPEGLFFARQTINNACATQAILSILLNANKRLELGDTLSSFREFAMNLDPESRGHSLEESVDIRTAHNSFSRPEPIQIEITHDDAGEDAFHFISYVPHNGFLYEIDGLQKGPRLIGDCTDDNWTSVARPIIQQRMQQYSGTELRFTLLGLVKNLKLRYLEEIDTLSAETDSARVTELKDLISSEDAKFDRWKKENIRRRHNYFPFIFNFLQVLAEKQVLPTLTKRAEEKKGKKLEARKAEEAKEKAKESEKETEKPKESGSETAKKDGDGDVDMGSSS